MCWWPSWMVWEPPKSYCALVWFPLTQWIQRRWLKCKRLQMDKTMNAKWWQQLAWPVARWANKRNICSNNCMDRYIYLSFFLLSLKKSKDMFTIHQKCYIIFEYSILQTKDNLALKWAVYIILSIYLYALWRSINELLSSLVKFLNYLHLILIISSYFQQNSLN